MLKKEEYLKSPCSASSLPFWKARNLSVPDNMLILHNSEFSEEYLENYIDERYFRLLNDMKIFSKSPVPGFSAATAAESDFKIMADIINRSYDDIKITPERLFELTETPVYAQNLWVLIKDTESGETAACGIADFDEEIGELVLEWIQVLPEYRGRGLGKMLVNELLCRMDGKAKFATVSGKADGSSNPEALYRKCGFAGDDIWHILRRK